MKNRVMIPVYMQLLCAQIEELLGLDLGLPYQVEMFEPEPCPQPRTAEVRYGAAATLRAETLVGLTDGGQATVAILSLRGNVAFDSAEEGEDWVAELEDTAGGYVKFEWDEAAHKIRFEIDHLTTASLALAVSQ